jgi:hypothetical protein
MEKLKVRVHFKSGRTLELTSHDYYKGQFREWCIRNFMGNNGSIVGGILWGDVFVNVSQIEYVEEVK